MIFRTELAKLIVQQRKSQTRRVVTSTTCRYEIGKSYAVQPGRGKPAICRITITDIRQERLGQITLRDAKREGFVTTQEFFDYWAELYGGVDREQRVWVISFVIGDQTDRPRLLAARPGPPHGDYTHEPRLAARAEPEPVSDRDLQRFAERARQVDSARLRHNQAERLAQPLHLRVAELEVLHEAGEVDVSRQLAPIRRTVQGGSL